MSGRRSCILTQETEFDPRGGQINSGLDPRGDKINTSCHWFIIDAILHSASWSKSRQWALQLVTPNQHQNDYNKNWIFLWSIRNGPQAIKEIPTFRLI